MPQVLALGVKPNCQSSLLNLAGSNYAKKKTTSLASEIAVDDGVVLKYPFLKLCKNLLPALSTYS